MKNNFGYKEPKLPKELRDEYIFVSCLKYNQAGAVFLVRKKDNEKKYILKKSKGTRRTFLKNENDTLKKLDEPFLPKVYCFFEKKKSSWLLRDYIEGDTLFSLVDEKGPFNIREAVDIVSMVAECVKKLHRMNPPLIHRDLKPENIIRKKDGSIVFIDLDTVRAYKNDGFDDTVYAVSLHTSAPESYGFMQSDVRADVYSLGVLLLFLTTGEYSSHTTQYRRLPNQLRSIIKKALSFDPSDRYKSVDSMHKDLSCLKIFRLRRSVLATGVSALAVFLTITGGLIFSAIRHYNYIHDSYSFADSLIEEAVRAELGKEDEDVITKEELSEVTTLCICNGEVYTSLDEHQKYHDNYWFEFEDTATVSRHPDLSDLKHLTGLHTLILDNYGVSELSEISRLPIKKLDLRKNQITDLSDLSMSSTLTEITLDDNPVQDISPLNNCKKLKFIDICNMPIDSLDELAGLPLEHINATSTSISDFSVLKSFDNLKWFFASGLNNDDLEYISKLYGLEYLGLFGSDITDLSVIKELKNLVCIDVTNSIRVSDLNWLKDHPKLDYLGITGTSITNIAQIKELRQLTNLDIHGISPNDLSVLTELKSLSTLCIDSSIESKISTLNLPESVEIIVVD